MTSATWSSVIWVIAASVLGFGVSALFSARLNLTRRTFLIPYVILTSAFLYGFVAWSQVNLSALFAKNWIAGVVGGVLVATFLVRNVRSQPLSRQSHGIDLGLDLAWSGLIYGLIDGLFLNVMPVYAVWHGFAGTTLVASLAGKILIGVLALLASLLVTLAYHVGYREFRNHRVVPVLLGNAVMTLAYVLAANPLSALISHTVMHLAAVLQGPETTIQLPPHLVRSS